MSDCLNAQLCRDGPACISVVGNLAELLDEELVMSGVEPKEGSSSTSTKYGGVKKIETLTLSELNAYITSPHSVPEKKSKRGKKAFFYMVSHQNQSCLDREYLQTQNDIDQNVVSVQTHAFGFFNQVPQEPLYAACEICFRPLKLSTRTTNW
ncbi:hypothetical protein F2Q70_00039367 [Brassica cretica]|uniref:Uncharacterized protein n=1 Tax=Brassica cretica TaxID=69181 RepID=A0A8S9JZQ9_BRACR|nr:hypothetical protein F2Q70_00039367 [Brassica cretica]